MLALFIAVSIALALLLWVEYRPFASAPPKPAAAAAVARMPVTTATAPPPAARPAAPRPAVADADDVVMARLQKLLSEPAPLPAAEVAPAAEDLPRIAGFRPRDVLELEITGPLPRPEDLRFEQVGRDARLILEGQPALILEGVPAHRLRPSHIRFRSPQAA